MTVAGVSSTLVHVYDSVYDYTLSDTKMQIAAILCSRESTITLKIHKVQFQKGHTDCGLFAIAYATDLAYGNDPASYIYKQEELGAHFLDSLDNNILSPFPKDTAYPGRPKLEGFEIFCSCRLPDNYEERMAKCATCKEWYHQSCETIGNHIFEDSKILWKCSKCEPR